MGGKGTCPICGTERMITNEGRLYKHTATGRFCDGSGQHMVVKPAQANPVDIDPNAWLMNQGANGPEPAEMTGLAAEIAARMKEIFHAYNHRRTEDNRNAQQTLGPSEIGTPCDRRLAMSLMRVEPVNPGGDGWAAFVGTCVHAGLAEMLAWSNAGSGRFAVEMPLTYQSALVPKGTGDALDRVLLCFLDHKAMGQWSLSKLKREGPSALYRTQVHVYAKGARAQGEKVEHVALIGWPRVESTLDELFVWTEPYDATVAQRAFERVERINAKVQEGYGFNEFAVAKDCAYCPFFLKDGDNSRSCNGKL